MNTAGLLKPDDALAAHHGLTVIEGAAADAIVEGAPGRGPDNRDVLTVTGDLAAMMRETWTALTGHNRSNPRLFRTPDCASIVEVAETETGPTLRRFTEDTWRAYLVNRIRFMKASKKGVEDALPCRDLVKTTLATPDKDLPVLSRLITVPVAGPDGAFLTTQGYNVAARAFYQPPAGFRLPPIPEAPTAEDIRNAGDLLWSPISEFPFTSDAEIAHTIGAMLLPFVRDLIDGPTPLHLISKPEKGTGASLLCDVISLIATGRTAPAGVQPHNDEEARKRITAALISGSQIVMLDNVKRLEGASLAAALTSMTWTDRLLGQSATVQIPVRCLWLATANNPAVSGEIARRVVRIRLDAKREDPGTRTFEIPDLRGWCHKYHAHLVAAALTLVKAWMRAGRPSGSATLGSYERWASVIGGILDVAGFPDFLANRTAFNDEANTEDADAIAFVKAWLARYGYQTVGVNDLFSMAEDIFDLGSGSDTARRTRLGKTVMRDLCNRIVCGVRIEDRGTYQGGRRYQLVDVNPAVCAG